MKIKAVLLTFAVINTTILGGFAYISTSMFKSNNETIRKAMDDNDYYQSLNTSSFMSQLEFRKQLQTWKNLTLRGENPKDYENYLASFGKSEKKVRDELNKSNDQLKLKINAERDPIVREKLNGIKIEIENTLLSHKNLGEKYRESLTAFTEMTTENLKKIDTVNRSIDNSVYTPMDKNAEDVKKLKEVEAEKLNKVIEEKNKENINILLIATGVLFLLITSLLLALRIYILRVLGAEPSDLNEYFKLISQGQFKTSIEVEEKYENSIAYNSKMMHFKLRNMIKTIKRLTEEIAKVKDTKVSDEHEKIVDALRIAKTESRALKETVDKFEF
jgi:methyl-accepting chemotaxis protein